MTENNTLLRTTTISLDEYNKLQNEVNSLRETKGALQTTIQNQYSEIQKLSQTQPVVKLIHGKVHHYHDDYDGGSSESFAEERVEFVNLTEVERIAKENAKKEVEENLTNLETELKGNKYLIKTLRENIDVVQDKAEQKDKLIKKMKLQQSEELVEKTELYEKNIEQLKKAVKEDTTNYKETIKELKDEIQKVKDSKTDAEIEEKRNKEIKDLKGRIKDLETMIAELGKLNMFKRIWKLRQFSNEALAVHEALAERERNANKVGTTWVKDNGKYRSYNSFSNMLDSIYGRSMDAYTYFVQNLTSTARGWF